MSLAVAIEAANEIILAADSRATIAPVGMAETGAALIQRISPALAALHGGGTNGQKRIY
jgi:hypothetical protein